MPKYIARQVTPSYIPQDETDEDNTYDSRQRDGEALELNATYSHLNASNVHEQCKASLCSETVNQAHESISTR